MIDVVLEKLIIIIKKSGLQRKKIAEILGINEIHFSKVMNGKASLTQKMAKNLAKISQLHITEKEILYPDINETKKIAKYVLNKIKKPIYFGTLFY